MDRQTDGWMNRRREGGVGGWMVKEMCGTLQMLQSPAQGKCRAEGILLQNDFSSV